MLGRWFRESTLLDWFRPYVFNKWCVLLFAPPGNGKSLELARLSDKLFREYHKTERRYPYLHKRMLFSQQLLLHPKFDKERLDGHYIYFTDIEEIRYCRRRDCWKSKDVHLNHDCDIFVDEAMAIFPADGWKTTADWVKLMFREHRHRSIRWLLATQDYSGIDIMARRGLTEAFLVRKIRGSRDISPSLPPLSPWTILNFLNPRRRVIWGYYTVQHFDPLVLKQDPMSFMTASIHSEFAEDLLKLKLMGKRKRHFITWYKVSLYDTQQDVTDYDRKMAKLGLTSKS